MIDITALFTLSYGIYLICADDGETRAGCLVNTVFQLTAEPIRVCVSVSKQNQTHDVIAKKRSVCISVMGQEAPTKLLGTFGYWSGRDKDKFAASPRFHCDAQGNPAIDEGCIAQMSCEVREMVDVETHTLFICDVIAAQKVGTDTPMTYQYFREVKKGQSSKYAPTYVDPAKLKENQSGH